MSRIQVNMLTMTAAFQATDASTAQLGEWVSQAAAGDRSAFEKLYRSHARRVFSVIWRLMGGNEARAEELTQEAFVKAWQALPSFRGDSAFSTWLHRLAVNTALMDLRANANSDRQELNDIELEQFSAPTSSRSAQLDLAQAVQSLPPRARAVLLLYDVEGWTHQEIAGELGMAVGSSKAQLHRARGLLRQRLEGHGNG